MSSQSNYDDPEPQTLADLIYGPAQTERAWAFAWVVAMSFEADHFVSPYSMAELKHIGMWWADVFHFIPTASIQSIFWIATKSRGVLWPKALYWLLASSAASDLHFTQVDDASSQYRGWPVSSNGTENRNKNPNHWPNS